MNQKKKSQMLQLKFSFFFKNVAMLNWPYSYGNEHQSGRFGKKVCKKWAMQAYSFLPQFLNLFSKLKRNYSGTNASSPLPSICRTWAYITVEKEWRFVNRKQSLERGHLPVTVKLEEICLLTAVCAYRWVPESAQHGHTIAGGTSLHPASAGNTTCW